MFLDVKKVLIATRGGPEFVLADHILTHHQRGDIILCNSHDGTPVPVVNKITSNSFGSIRKPPDDNVWIVLVVAGRNGIIHKVNTPTGAFYVKIEELRHLGYHASLILWNVFSALDTFEKKRKYLDSCIKEAINGN